MAITISEITDSEQWDGFLTSQPREHILQSYEWGELNKYLGGHIYRLGALDNGRLVGAMLVLVAQVPLPLKIPGIHFNWLYCCRGPAVEKLDAPALSALVEYAHSIARKEHAVVLRLEPNIADGDPDVDDWLAAYCALGFHINPIAVHGRRIWLIGDRATRRIKIRPAQDGDRRDEREHGGAEISLVVHDADAQGLTAQVRGQFSPLIGLCDIAAF